MALATYACSVVVQDPEYATATWLAALTFGVFALALHHPSWILIPVILTELTLYSYSSPSLGAAHRLAIVLAAALIGGVAILRGTRFVDLHFRRVILPCIAFLVIATAVNAMHSQDEYVLQYFRYQVGQLLVAVLAATLISTRRDLLRVAQVTLVIGVIAAIAAILQHFAPTFALYGAADAETVRAWKGRSIGLSANPIALANQMTFVLAPLIGVILCGAWRIDRLRIMLGTVAFLLFAGLTFSYTRSGFFALGPGLIAMGLLLRGYRRAFIVGAVICAILFFPALENTGLLGHRYFKDANEDQSAATHEALWEVSLAIALDHPVDGIGHEHFEAVSLDYIDAVDDDSREISGASSIGGHRPHNDFLSVWVSWGIFALIAYLGIFLGTLRNLLIASRHHDLLIRGLAVGGVGGLVIYAVNSAYHNYMDSSVALWLYAGLSVALVRVAKSEVRPEIRLPLARRFSRVPGASMPST